MMFASKTEKKFSCFLVAPSFAKKLFHAPEGPYKKIPFHGFFLPLNN